MVNKMEAPKQQRLSLALRSRRHHMVEVPAVIEQYRKPSALLVEMRALTQFDNECDPDEDDCMITQDGIGILSVCGILSNDSYWADRSYRSITALAQAYEGKPECKAVLMVADSPGGDTEGAFEAQIAIAKMAAAKPMYCAVDTGAYSACYLLATPADQIYVPPITGGVGSVGVYSMHVDMSKMLKMAGVDVTFITAGRGKVDGNFYEPLTDEARADLQLEIDRLYDEFTGAVSRGRNISVDAIKAIGAACLSGPAALVEHLADRVGSLRSAYADLVAKISTSSRVSLAGNARAGMASAMKGGTQMSQVQQDAVVDIATARSSGMADGVNYAAEVVDLCILSGDATAATGFIKASTPLADIRAKLLAAKVARDAATSTRTAALIQDAEPEFSFAGYVAKQQHGGAK